MRSQTVLIIDDDKEFRMLVRKILEATGLEVQEAQSVQSGIELALQRAPDLILTDIMMAGENGLVLLEKRKQLPEISRVSTIVVSAVDKPDLIYHAMSMGATDYVVKPIKPQQLLQRVRKALKDKGFRRVFFLNGSGPTVNATFQGRISRAGEPGFELEAPVRLGRLAVVQVSGEILEQLGLAKCTFKTSLHAGALGNHGQYLNGVRALGLTEEMMQKVRAEVRFWK